MRTLRFDRRVCVRSDLIVEYVRTDLIVECAYAQIDRRVRTHRFDRRVCVRSDLIVECAYAEM